MSLCGGGGSNAAGAAAQSEEARQGRISQGLLDINRQFAGFNEPFYEKRRRDYMQFALPQLGEETQGAQRQLAYRLANQGLLGSTAAGQAEGALNSEVQKQRQAIVDAAFGQSQDLRRQVEGQRTSLVTQLEGSADPLAVNQQALAAANQFSAPSTFQPLSGLLNNFANMYLANQVANQYRSDQQRLPGLYTAPLAGSAQLRK